MVWDRFRIRAGGFAFLNVQKAWFNQVSEGCGNVARCVQCGGVCENKFLIEVSGEYPAK